MEENSTVTLTVDVPSHKVILFKDGKVLKPSDRIKIVKTSSTTTEIRISKAKPDDQGKYSIVVDKKEQPLVQLKVIPKPVIRQTMDLPQTTFNEGETLTIKCEFDSKPEETFEILHNGKPLLNDDRVSTIVEETTYTIIVKNLRPKEDEGVYTLKSTYLILETPSITVLPVEEQPETTTVVEEEETITFTPNEQQPDTLDQKVSACTHESRSYLRATIDHDCLQKPRDIPVHEVEEDSTVTLTIEKPAGTSPDDVILLKDGEELKPSDHVKITPTSPTTTEIQIVKAKPEDEGDYTVKVKDTEQPLVRLKVHPKPVIRQEMQLPKTQFNARETLTIVCQFDSTPEEPFVFMHNDQPLVPDSRISTTVEDNKYTIVVKDLRPDEDEGVYTLKSDHLVLDTPSITIVPEEEKLETTTVEEDEETQIVAPGEEQPKKGVEDKKKDKQVSDSLVSESMLYIVRSAL